MPNLDVSLEDAYIITNPFGSGSLQAPNPKAQELRKSGNTVANQTSIQIPIPALQQINSVAANRVSLPVVAQQMSALHASSGKAGTFNQPNPFLKGSSNTIVIHPVPQMLTSKYANTVVLRESTYFIR